MTSRMSGNILREHRRGDSPAGGWSRPHSKSKIRLYCSWPCYTRRFQPGKHQQGVLAIYKLSKPQFKKMIASFFSQGVPNAAPSGHTYYWWEPFDSCLLIQRFIIVKIEVQNRFIAFGLFGQFDFWLHAFGTHPVWVWFLHCIFDASNLWCIFLDPWSQSWCMYDSCMHDPFISSLLFRENIFFLICSLFRQMFVYCQIENLLKIIPWPENADADPPSLLLAPGRKGHDAKKGRRRWFSPNLIPIGDHISCSICPN